MTDRARRIGKVAVRAIATLALLGYLAASVDAEKLAESFGSLDARCWLVAVALYAASQLVSSYRWGQLARAAGFVETHERMAAHYFAGAFVNVALPSSLGGDALRALRLAPGDDLTRKVAAAGTVVVDRLAGLSALLMLGGVGLLAHARGWGAWALAGAALLAFTLHVAATWPALGLARRARLTSLRRLSVLEPYLRSPPVLARASAWSWVVQLLNIATVMWLGLALGMSLPLATYFMAVPAAAVLAILPLSISGLGAREVGLAWLLPVAPEQAVSLGLLWFSVSLATGLLGGAPFLMAARPSARTESQLSLGRPAWARS